MVSGLPRSLPALPPLPAPPCIPCVEGRQRAAPHSSLFPPIEAPLQTLHLDLRERFQSDFPVLRLHSDRGGEFSSDLLAAFCAEHGIRQTFTLPASPQQNGVAERRIGLVMEVARTSMIHVAAPHFLWPFAVRYAAHQLNLWPRVSLPETSPTLLWTGKVGDASRFWVWGARAFVRDTIADKLSPRAIPCVFLGFVPDAPGWQFYDPASRRVLASQDVTFDESVPFYHLFPYRTAPRPLPPLFLIPGPPQVDPLPAPAPAPSGVSQVDPPVPVPVEVTDDYGPAGSGAVPGGAELGDAESGGAERVEPGGAEPAREEPGGAASGGAASEGAAFGGAESGGESPAGSETTFTRSPWSSRLRPRVPLTSQQLQDWYGRRQRRASAPQGSTAGGSSAGVAGPGGACTEGTGASGAGGVVTEGTGATEGAGAAGGIGATGGADGAGAAEGTGAAGGAGPAEGPGATGGAGAAEGTGAAGGAGAAGAVQTEGLAERREPASRPISPVRSGRSGRCVPRQRQTAVSGPPLVVRRPSSPPPRVPLPSPPASSLPVVADPVSDQFCAEHSTVTRLLATVVTDPSFESAAASALVAELVDFAAACRLDYAASIVAEFESVCPPFVGGDCALGTDVLEDTQEDLECLAAAAPHLVAMLLAPEGDPNAPDIPTPCLTLRQSGVTERELISSRPSPTPKMTTLRVLLHVAAQRDYELHSLDFSTTFLHGSLHEEIWLRRPPGFTGSFPPGTQWSLRRPVYGLRQAPREWHDTMRMTLAALGFAPSTADPSLFLRTDTSLPPFYILVNVDDFVFATVDTEALALVKSELQKRHTCTDLGHSLSAPPSDESVEPNGPYPELVGCLMYLMTCTRPDLAYPLGLLARYVAPGRHRKVHMDAAKRVLRYLCSTSGMGLMLGGRGDVVLTSHSDASWVDDQATRWSSQGYTLSISRLRGDVVIHPELVLHFLSGLVTLCSPPLYLWGTAPSPREPCESRRHVEFAATSGEYAVSAPMPLKPPRPPCFDSSQRGGPTVQSWVFTMNVFFDANYVESDAAKIRYAVLLLRGPAMDWWRVIMTSPRAYEPPSQEDGPTGLAVTWSSLCETAQYSTWDAWCAGLRARFEPIAASISARQKLHTWRQLGSVQDYYSGFLALCKQVGYMHEAERVDRYVGGLKPDISHEIMLRGLSNFNEILALAEKIDILRRPRLGSYYGQRPRGPIEHATVHAVPTNAAAAPFKGRCFACNRPGHRKSECPEELMRRGTEQGRESQRPGNASSQ
ncbi:unnamed protein product [Closterium sp. NIES-54]